jgi:hypothetical protein
MHRRRDMDTDETIHLGHHLNIIRNLIPRVMIPTLLDLDQLQKRPLLHPNTLLRQRGQPAVGLVARLGRRRLVVVLGLMREERGREVPEAVRRQLEHGQRGLVHERRRRVPRLDLLAQQHVRPVRVRRAEGRRRQHLVVQRVEHLGAEGADVVEDCGGALAGCGFGGEAEAAGRPYRARWYARLRRFYRFGPCTSGRRRREGEPWR